jgi:hypothetical protein
MLTDDINCRVLENVYKFWSKNHRREILEAHVNRRKLTEVYLEIKYQGVQWIKSVQDKA